MSSVVTSAPGKIVFCGEYVVLDGAPAVGVAVNRRSRVSLYTHAEPVGTLHCPGYSGQPLCFSYAGGRADWQGDEALALVDAALERVPLPTGFGGELDTSAFGDATGKLGLGSSAALAVAMVAALAKLGGQEPDLALADTVHRNFQAGRGSGLDVATCFEGGLVEFAGGGVTGRLSWPDGLHLGVYWSGVPSSTTEKIRSYRAVDPGTESRSTLAAASSAVIGALGSAVETVSALAEYARVLRSFDSDHGLGIYGAGHDAVADASRDLPLAYKPCGAGGGDIGIAVSADEESLAEFSRRAAGLGYTRLDVAIDDRGLIIEEWSP